MGWRSGIKMAITVCLFLSHASLVNAQVGTIIIIDQDTDPTTGISIDPGTGEPIFGTDPDPGNEFGGGSGGSSGGSSGSSGGGYTYGGGGSYGGGTQPAMTAVNPSMIPDIKCSLIDDHPYRDLAEAVNNLFNAVNPQDVCKTDPAAAPIFANSDSIRLAKDNVLAQWATLNGSGDPAMAKPFDSATFGTSLQSIVEGIQAIGSTVQTGLSPKCATALSKLDIIGKVGDIASAIAPYALLGAATHPGLAKIVLGAVGTGTVAKVMNSVGSKATMDMSTQINRRALMQNICEFFKIHRKLEFLNLVKATSIDAVLRDIQNDKEIKRSQLRDRLTQGGGNQKMLNLATFRDRTKAKIKLIDEQYRNDSKRYAETNFAKEAEGAEKCSIVKALLTDTSEKSLTKSVRKNIETALNVVEIQSKKIAKSKDKEGKDIVDTEFAPDGVAQTLLDSEKDLQIQFVKVKDTPSECAATAKAYMNNLARLLSRTYTTILVARERLKIISQADKAFSMFSIDEDRIEKEGEYKSKLARILTDMKQTGSFIDASEIEIQMNLLRTSLFEVSSGNFYSNAKSPAMAWLIEINNHYQRTIGNFNGNLAMLRSRLFHQKTETGKSQKPLQGLAQGSTAGFGLLFDKAVRGAKNSFVRWWKNDNLQTKSESDLQSVQSLEYVTAANYPKATQSHAYMCDNLKAITVDWTAAMDHWATQKLFCETIHEIKKSGIGQDITDHCFGQKDEDQKYWIKIPLLEQTRLGWIQGNAKKDALLVRSKLAELQCPNDDPSLQQPQPKKDGENGGSNDGNSGSSAISATNAPPAVTIEPKLDIFD